MAMFKFCWWIIEDDKDLDENKKDEQIYRELEEKRWNTISINDV